MLLPPGARVLSIQLQRDQLQVWCLVSYEALLLPVVARSFRLVGTGHNLDIQGLTYVATVQENGGEYIWHIFEKIGPHPSSGPG